MAGLLVLGALVTAAPEVAHARQRPLFIDPLEELFQPPRRIRRAVSRVASVPLPRPRPADAPQNTTTQPGEPEAPSATTVPMPESRPAEADRSGTPSTPTASSPQAPSESPPVPPQTAALSACRIALTDQIAVAPSIPDINGPGACGGTDLVRLEAIVLPGAVRVPLKPAATLRCEMATAIVDWVRDDMVPLAASLKSSLAELDNFDSFDCRGRNRVKGAKLSEHGRANALDVRGLKLANGQTIALTDRATPRETRERVLQSVCQRFTTVLGPGSDGYHEDHIHLDIAVRRGGYKICQWIIYEPMPQIAPLMPAERPADAPPREVAEGQTNRPEAGAAAQPAPEPSGTVEDAAPEPAPTPKATKPSRKRRTQRM